MVSERSPLVTFLESLSACSTACLTVPRGTSATAWLSVVAWRSPWDASLDMDISVAALAALSEELELEEFELEE